MDIQDIAWQRTEYSFEGSVSIYVPVFEKELEVSMDFEGETVTSKQLEALQSFLMLPPGNRRDITHRIALNCQDACLQYRIDGDDPPIELACREDIWNYLSLSSLHVPRLGSSADRYVFISGNCDWEEEHGLEMLFKNDALFDVGPIECLYMNEAWARYYIDE